MVLSLGQRLGRVVLGVWRRFVFAQGLGDGVYDDGVVDFRDKSSDERDIMMAQGDVG